MGSLLVEVRWEFLQGRDSLTFVLFRSEPVCSSCAGTFSFDLAIARLDISHQRIQQIPGSRTHLLDGTIERHFVCLRRLIEARELSHELEGSFPNLLVGSWGVKIEQGLDVPAHNLLLVGLFQPLQTCSRRCSEKRKWS